jgi:hypothetical protein
VGAWFILTRLQKWLDGGMSKLDTVSREPADSERANDFVRGWGFAVALGGVWMLIFGRGWVVWGVLPLQGFGALSVAFGGWMFTFPAKYRGLRSRFRR